MRKSSYKGPTEARRIANRAYYQRHKDVLNAKTQARYRELLDLGGLTKTELKAKRNGNPSSS